MKPKFTRMIDGIPCMTVTEHDEIVASLKREWVGQAEKPVAYKWKGELFTPGEIEMLDVDDAVPLYEHQRQWVGMTEEEIDELNIDKDGLPTSHLEFAWAIEAKLKEKNT